MIDGQGVGPNDVEVGIQAWLEGRSLPSLPHERIPLVRPAYRILSRAHESVSGLFSTFDLIEGMRKRDNGNAKGRRTTIEIDIVRSSIVLTSAGLDAAMKRLVNDCGFALCKVHGTGAWNQFQEHLKSEMSRPNVSASFRNAVLDINAGDALVRQYLSERSKASFQGSSDLQNRVRNTLGIPKSEVPDAEIVQLNDFFVARNSIVHDMDLVDPNARSLKRHHRRPEDVADQCYRVFSVAFDLIRAAAGVCKKSGL